MIAMPGFRWFVTISRAAWFAAGSLGAVIA